MPPSPALPFSRPALVPRSFGALLLVFAGGASLSSAASSEPVVRKIGPGEAGFYEIRESVLTLRAETTPRAALELRAEVVRGDGASANRVVVENPVAAGESFHFDNFAGYLSAGDALRVTARAPAVDELPAATVEKLAFELVRAPAIPVSRLSEEAAGAGSGWSLFTTGETVAPAERRLAPGRPADDRASGFVFSSAGVRLRRAAGEEGASVASFRVPHSGFYALHETRAAVKSPRTGALRLRVFAGDAERPLFERVIRADGPATALDGEIGYVAKGDAIHLVFSAAEADAPVDLEFDATLVEWAPRRAPLRVARGVDGLLDVLEPEAPRRRVDIPADRWVEIPAAAGDRTEAIREGLARAQKIAEESGDGYAGVRLQAGARYSVAGAQTGGRLFDLKKVQRVVIDGNGATLFVASPELQRKNITLFATTDSRRIVFADLVVDSGPPPFATGDIVSTAPAQDGGHTVTFRLDPGSPDPIADIARTGTPSAYVYDPLHPGRMAAGVWSHYPGGSPVRPAGPANLFTHTVRRTAGLPEQGKWLVKNKGGGVIYLTTYGGSEDITLSGLDCRAPGGGLLRFWSADAVNILDCKVEPRGSEWIASTADGVHGRGREGVWIEDTLLRGVCEDVMNTYAQSMVVLDEPAGGDDSTVTLKIFYPGRRTPDGEFALGNLDPTSVLPGDPLTFFDPKSGRELGRVVVRSVDREGRCVLSAPVPAGVSRWKKGSDRKTTMVYSLRQTTRFFVRDSRFMDGMRFGIFMKAEGGVVFNTHFEGLASNPILAANEPEWPEGPVPANLWVQGCTFSQNNNSYIIEHRDFLAVDPAAISVYARRMSAPGEPNDFRAHLVRDQYLASHVKVVGNVFHDWAGMGVAVRNSRNVEIRGNLFLPPVEKPLLRKTLAADPSLADVGRPEAGAYAGVFLASVGGARVEGNRFAGLPEGDRALALGEDVAGLRASDNRSGGSSTPPAPDARLTFSEWFGDTAADPAGTRLAKLEHVARVNGRLGAGLRFDDPKALATLPASTGSARRGEGWSVGLWICPDPLPAPRSGVQVIYSQGDSRAGVVVALRAGRLVAGAWRDDRGAWLDLGEATAKRWTHVGLVCDGARGVLHGFVDGVALASARDDALRASPLALDDVAAVFGNAAERLLLGPALPVAPRSAPYRGKLDEFVRLPAALAPADMALLAFRHL